MESQVFTIHRHPRSGEVEAVGDGAGWLAALPPLWALWEGLWPSLAAMLALLGLAATAAPAAVAPVWLALAALCKLEGGAVHRLDLRLRGWRLVALAQAATAEGAEELWLTGRAQPVPGAGRAA